MYLGNVVEIIEEGKIEGHTVHPYSQALLKAVFKVHFKPGEKIQTLEGEVPSPLDLPSGCPFKSRCEKCSDICRSEKPQLRKIDEGHYVACHFVE